MGQRHAPSQTDDHPGGHPSLRSVPRYRALLGARSAGDFASLEAGGADVEPLRTSGDDGAHALDVRVPAPVGLLLGPGDVVAESGPLAAYVTYRSHWTSLPRSGR